MTITTQGEITRHQRSKRPTKVAMVYASDNRERTFEELDLDACRCANYQVLFPSPRTRELERIFLNRFTAGLTEDSLASDSSTSNINDLLPPYNASSTDGEVEAELVFVNYGTPG